MVKHQKWASVHININSLERSIEMGGLWLFKRAVHLSRKNKLEWWQVLDNYIALLVDDALLNLPPGIGADVIDLNYETNYWMAQKFYEAMAENTVDYVAEAFAEWRKYREEA